MERRPYHGRVATSVTAKMEARDADERPFYGGAAYAGTMAFTPTGLSTSSRRYDFCDGLASSTRRRVATFRRSASNTCPASAQPMRRPHAIIFRPFRSSPKSSTMHFMHTSSLPRYSPLSSLRVGRCSGVSSWLVPLRCSCWRSSNCKDADRCCIRRCPWT